MHRQKSKLKISRLTRNLTLNPQRKNSKVFFNWWFKFTRIDHRVESRESTLENVDWKHGDFFSSEADGGEKAVLGNLVLVEQTRKNKALLWNIQINVIKSDLEQVSQQEFTTDADTLP